MRFMLWFKGFNGNRLWSNNFQSWEMKVEEDVMHATCCIPRSTFDYIEALRE